MLVGEGTLKLKLLLAHPKVDPSAKNIAMIRAAENGHLTIVKFLFRQNADPSFDDSYAFRRAVTLEHLSIIELFLAHPNLTPSSCNDSAFRKAAGNKGRESLKIVKLLLEDPRAFPQASSIKKALEEAAENGAFKIIDAIFDFLIKNRSSEVIVVPIVLKDTSLINTALVFIPSNCSFIKEIPIYDNYIPVFRSDSPSYYSNSQNPFPKNFKLLNHTRILRNGCEG